MKSLRFAPKCILLLLIILCMPSSGKGQAPIITSFTPGSGPVGSSITITGSNFGITPSDNIVYFGQVGGVVTAATASSLTVTVPSGAACAPISVTTNHLTALSNLSFHVTFPSTDTLTRSSFTLGGSIRTGTSTFGLTAADFDGDGKPDLADANGSDNTISVMKNLSTPGIISLAPKFDLAVGHTATNMAAGDFDGDGMLDLATTGSGANVVSVFRNSSTPGTIAFDSRADFATGASPDQIATGDLDGDGKIDLLVVDLHADSVTILRNTGTPGTIAFAPKQIMAAGTNAGSIAVGDMDNDGKPDLVACRGSVVTVFRNISTPGNIAFATGQDIPLSASLRNIILADFDGDGRLDLAGPASSADAAVVFRNTTSGGTFSFGGAQSDSTDPAPIALTTSDFDGDGILDLAALSQIWNSTTLLHGSSTPGSILFNYGVPVSAGFAPEGIVATDLDGDGRPDIATTSLFNGTVDLRRNVVPAASPAFQLSTQRLFFRSIAVGGSIADTVIVTNPGQATLSITNILSTDAEFVVSPASATIPKGSLQAFIITYTPAPGGVATDTISFVHNAPSSPDLLFINVNVLPANPPTIVSFSPHTGSLGSSVSLTGSNFDPNPVNDIVYFGPIRAAVISASTTSLDVRVPPGTGYAPVSITTGGLTASTTTPFGVTFISTDAFDSASFAPKADFPVPETPQGLVSADLNGDGKADIITWYEDVGTVITVLQNTTDSGTVSFTPVLSLSSVPSPYEIVTGDIDGDGRLDLVIGRGFDGITILMNTSTGGTISFSTPVTIPVNYVGNIGVQDIDADGRPDLVITKGPVADTMGVLMNVSSAGSIAFAPEMDFHTAHNPGRMAFGDFDGDGKPDIALIHIVNTVGVFHNTSIPGSVSFDGMIPLTAGTNPYGITACDLDGDGKTDIAETNYGNNISSSQTVMLFHNNSAGSSISFSSGIVLRAGAYPAGIAVCDLNGDGMPDLAVTNPSVGTISLLRNVSTPGVFSFAPVISYPTGQYPSDLLLQDMDGDGRPDMITANYSGSSVSFLRNNLPALRLHFQDGWNLVSAPLVSTDYRRTILFPGSISKAFAYDGTYLGFDTLVPGTGYWLRFNGAPDIKANGSGMLADSVPVIEGWNLIGGISKSLAVNEITSVPGGLVTTQFFGYDGGYAHSDTIRPGHGYWVKVSSAGELILASSSQTSPTALLKGSTGTIRIVPTSEQPPPPPGGQAETPVPGEFSLAQNYPNPFNPTTTISYELPKQSQVTLKIFDILGCDVLTLVNRIEEPGYRSVVFNAQGLPSGIYFYRLQAGNFTETRKLLLLK